MGGPNTRGPIRMPPPEGPPATPGSHPLDQQQAGPYQASLLRSFPALVNALFDSYRKAFSTVWDEEYSVDEYVYGTSPNDFLLNMTGKLKKGRVLCLAEGEGRNAVHLAMNGFVATAVDSSRVGLGKAERLAKYNSVEINIVHADLADYAIAENEWDSIISISCHLHPDLRKKVHKSIISGLTKGGTFLLEAYTPKQLEFGTGGPPSAEYMMDLVTLRDELSGLSIIHGMEMVRDVVEGINHTGKGSVVQVLAERI